MAVLTEYAQLAVERERVAKRRLPAIELAAWRWRPKPAPAVDHYQWLDPFASAPAITEIEE